MLVFGDKAPKDMKGKNQILIQDLVAGIALGVITGMMADPYPVSLAGVAEMGAYRSRINWSFRCQFKK